MSWMVGMMIAELWEEIVTAEPKGMMVTEAGNKVSNIQQWTMHPEGPVIAYRVPSKAFFSSFSVIRSVSDIDLNLLFRSQDGRHASEHLFTYT